jgi:hypothetical protein
MPSGNVCRTLGCMPNVFWKCEFFSKALGCMPSFWKCQTFMQNTKFYVKYFENVNFYAKH